MAASLEDVTAEADDDLERVLVRMRAAAMLLGARLDDVSLRAAAARSRLDSYATEAERRRRSCASCGWTLAWRRRDARYCSAACRSRAARARRRN